MYSRTQSGSISAPEGMEAGVDREGGRLKELRSEDEEESEARRMSSDDMANG